MPRGAPNALSLIFPPFATQAVAAAHKAGDLDKQRPHPGTSGGISLNYAEQQRNPGKHAVGIGIVVVMHILLGLGAGQWPGAHGDRGHQGPDRNQDHRRDQAAAAAAGEPAAAAEVRAAAAEFRAAARGGRQPAADAGADDHRRPRSRRRRPPVTIAPAAPRRRRRRPPRPAWPPGRRSATSPAVRPRPTTTRRSPCKEEATGTTRVRFTVDATGKLVGAEVVQVGRRVARAQGARPRRGAASSASARSGPASTRTARPSAARSTSSTSGSWPADAPAPASMSVHCCSVPARPKPPRAFVLWRNHVFDPSCPRAVRCRVDRPGPAGLEPADRSAGPGLGTRGRCRRRPRRQPPRRPRRDSAHGDQGSRRQPLRPGSAVDARATSSPAAR